MMNEEENNVMCLFELRKIMLKLKRENLLFVDLVYY